MSDSAQRVVGVLPDPEVHCDSGGIGMLGVAAFLVHHELAINFSANPHAEVEASGMNA